MYFKNNLFRVLILHKSNNFKWMAKCYATDHGNINKIGFIGLGAMGSRMAAHVVKKFKTVKVFDINESASLKLAEEGATVAKKVEDLNDSDCIISMIATNQQVLDVYQSPSGLISKANPGTLIIDCSTVDPEVPQKLAKEAQERNITFVDAPVSGGVLAAASGQLTFMVGGSAEGAQRSEPILQCMGKNVIHCGSSGSGQVAKICNNLLLGITMIATAEAMNLGIRLGLEPKLLANVINSSSGRCWSSDTYNPVPGVLEGVPSSKSYQGGFMSRLIVKDLTIAQSIANRTEIPTPFGNQAIEIYKQICQQGMADMDFSVVYQFIKDFTKK